MWERGDRPEAASPFLWHRMLFRRVRVAVQAPVRAGEVAAEVEAGGAAAEVALAAGAVGAAGRAGGVEGGEQFAVYAPAGG